MATTSPEQATLLNYDLSVSLPTKMDTSQGQEKAEGLDEETPLKSSSRASKTSLKSEIYIACVLLPVVWVGV